MNTNYIFISDYDNYGYPSKVNLDENNNNIKETISAELKNEIDEVLVNNNVIDNHPDWARKSSIVTTDNCEINLTFLDEQAGYKNALSYYVYDIDNPPTRFSEIDNIYIIYPNASRLNSGGKMVSGDTMKLAYEVTSYTVDNNKKYAQTLNYVFPKDKGVSFVVHSNRWKLNGTSNRFLSIGHQMYSSDPVLNPEPRENIKHHFVNFRSSTEPDKIIYGAEDILRTKAFCDHDFNDLIFYVTPTPMTAILNNSYNSLEEQEFTGTILCEDLLNRPKADLDYDDLCLEYKVTEIINNNKIQSIVFFIKGLCRGASLDHDFGVVIPNIKGMQNVKIIRETHIKSNNTNIIEYLANDIVNKGTDKVPLIKSTKNFLPEGTSWATNTINGVENVDLSYVTMKIIFPNGGISRSEINNLTFPYNFYLRVYRDDYFMWDLFSDELYDDVSDNLKNAGITEKKKIIILEGLTDVQYPLEKKPLRVAYYRFENYLKGDLRYTAWYSKKWAKEYLLYPKITDTINYTWNKTLGTNSEINGLMVLPHNSSTSWNYNNISNTLSKNNLTSSSVFDWDDITSENSETIIKFIQDFSTLHITKNGNYTFGVERGYFISLTSLQTNPNRQIYATFQSSSDTIELLSWTSKYSFFIVKI